MSKVAILPVLTAAGSVAYHAAGGKKLSQGKTAGEALDALTAQLEADEAGTLVIVQGLQPDAYFSADQSRRLGELMSRWRAARDAGAALPAAEQTELDGLIEEEVRASARRTAALLDNLAQ